MDLKNKLLSHFKPSFHRIVLTIIAISVYHNTYSHSDINWIKGGLIPALLFPAFYISYMYVYYPQNFNYENKNPTIPAKGIITEFNNLIHSPFKTIFIFLLLYLSVNFFLYKKALKGLPFLRIFRDKK